jgi:ribosomal protein S26
MRRRIQQQRQPSSTGHMKYVTCPSCGDAVAGRLPPDDTRQLTCVHCKHVFPFDESQVRQGLVTFDGSANRWRAALG